VASPLVRQVLRSQGRPLDGATRALLEPRFGHDFRHVRIHTGEHAAESARQMDAAAYTTGRHIVFGHGQYAPGSSAGRRLLAHELAHTIQQATVNVSDDLPIAQRHGSTELEAGRAADAVSAGRPYAVAQRGAPSIARQPASPQSQAAAADNRPAVEQALTNFLKQVRHADPKHPLAKNQRVWTEAMRLAEASRATPRPGPVNAPRAGDTQARMQQLLNSPTVPSTPAELSHAIVQVLPGPVDAAELEHLQSLSVFKPSQPKGIAGAIDRYGKLAPADMPQGNVVDQDEQRKLDLARGKERTSPTLTPQVDIPRTYGAVTGGPEKEKQEFVNPPVHKEEAPAPQGAVSHDVAAPAEMPATSVDRPIHFQVNLPATVVTSDAALRAALTREGIQDLDRVTGWLQRTPELSAQLTGMASIEGPAEHNQELSENRVRSVAAALVRAGIAATRIADVPGKPESCPRVGSGIYACGSSQSSKTVDPNDRQVRARVFAALKGPQKP
jgi:outer membrane protein OmpA-like peptidoglycan-associated protein